jgi:hypothetical protein
MIKRLVVFALLACAMSAAHGQQFIQNGLPNSISNPNNNQCLVYQSSTKSWVNGSCASGGGAAVTGSPVTGNLAKWSGVGTLSNVDLTGDATTSGSNVVTVTATHLTAPLPIAQGGTITGEAFGASAAASGSVNTAAINSALAAGVGGTVTLSTCGTYTVGSSSTVSFNGNTYSLDLVIPSNVRLVLSPCVTIKAAGGQTNPVLIQNSNPVAGAPASNSNIFIEGGIWDGNKANQTRSDGTAMCSFMVWFTGVTNLHLDNMTLSNSITYHTFFSSIKTLRINNILISDATPAVNGDGVHLHGNITDAMLRNIAGNAGDDLIAILPHDTAHSYTTVLDSGADTDILIDGVTGDQTAGARHLLDIVDFAAYPLSNTIVRNVHGKYTDGGVYIDAVSGVKQGLVVDGVDAQPLAGSNPTYAQIAIGGGGDSITIKNVNRYLADSVETGAKIPPIDFRSGTWSHVKIDSFSVGDLTAAGSGIGLIKVESGATVSEMSVSNFSAGSVVSSNALVWNAGTLGALKMTNGDTVRINQLLFTAGNISNGVWISNYRGDNIGGAVHILTSGSFTFPQLTMTGTRINETSTSSNGIFRFAGVTGTPLLQFHGNYFNNNGSSTILTRNGSETLRVQTVDSPMPVGTLTPATGDEVVDSVSGVHVVYNGSAWTYVDSAVQAPAFASTITPVFVVGTAGSGNVYNVGALTGAVTIANPAVIPPAGTRVTVNFVQDGTGGRAVSWGAAYQFPTAWSNTGNTLSTRSSISFMSDGTNLWALGANAWH